MDRAVTFSDAKSHRASRRNVGQVDRWVSGLLGGMMLTRTVTRKSGLGKVAALVSGTMLITRAATGHSKMYEALGVSSASLEQGAGLNLETAVTVDRPAQDLYRYWRDVSNLPGVMSDVQSVERNPDGTTHWRVKGPGRRTVLEWDAELMNDHPDRLIAWRSVEGSSIEQTGSVQFTPAESGQGTEVRVKMRYVPPAGIYGFGAAKVLNSITQKQLEEDLREFKRKMETHTTPTDMAARAMTEDAPGLPRPLSEPAYSPSGASLAPGDAP